LNFKDPESLNAVLGNVLKYGVLLSGLVTAIGAFLLAIMNGYSESSTFISYNPNRIPHGSFDVSLQGLINGLVAIDPRALIELGVILLIATPVARVLVSVFLFGAEGDRLYVILTAAVLAVLLFGILISPLIPAFNA
jgi:uncharacterized membrane protein